MKKLKELYKFRRPLLNKEQTKTFFFFVQIGLLTTIALAINYIQHL